MTTLPFPVELPEIDARPGASIPVRTTIRLQPSQRTLAHDTTLCDQASDILPVIDRMTAPDIRVKAWILHPDERVPMALVTGPAARWLAADPGLCAMLYAQALAEARRERVVWTPLLDRLATSDLWPTEPASVRMGATTYHVTPVSPSRVLEPLGGWIRTQAASAPFLPLCSFRSSAMLALLGIEAPVVDRRLFLHLVNETAVTAGALARNPNLTDGQTTELARIGLAWLSGPQSGRRAPVGRAVLAGLLARSDAALALALRPDLTALARGAADLPGDAPLPFETRAALGLLLGDTTLDAEALDGLYEATRGRPEWTVNVVTHRSASAALRDRAEREVTDAEVRHALSAITAALAL